MGVVDERVEWGACSRGRGSGQVAHRAIMTLVHAGSAPDLEVDVLIRAVANPDCPWPRAFPPATSRGVGGAARIEIQAPDR